MGNPLCNANFSKAELWTMLHRCNDLRMKAEEDVRKLNANLNIADERCTALEKENEKMNAVLVRHNLTRIL